MQGPGVPQQGLGASADGAWLMNVGLAEFGLPNQLTTADADQLLALGLHASPGGPPPVGAWGGDAAWGFSGGSGSAEEGSGTAVPASISEDRLEKSRAQNRAKQARFRQRQKEQKEQLAQQYEATAADLERQQQLNAALRLYASVLDAVKINKDCAINLLEAGADTSGQGAQQQKEQQPLAPQLPYVPPQGDCCDAGAGGSGAQQAVGMTPQQASSVAAAAGFADRMWALPFKQRVELCVAIFRGLEPVRQTLQEHGASIHDGFALQTDLQQKLGQHMVAAQPQMLDAVMAMTPEMLFKDWADFGDVCAETVEAVDSGGLGEEDAEKRLRGFVMYQVVLHALLLRYRPELTRQLLQYAKLPGESDEAATARWRQVAVSMGVTLEQARELRAPYAAYCARLEQLGTESAAALATVQEVQQHLSQQMGSLVGDSLSASMSQYLQLYHAAGQLSQQPDAALMATMELFSMTGAVVTPLQNARMMALCCPLHPDVGTIVREGLDHYGLLEQAGA